MGINICPRATLYHRLLVLSYHTSGYAGSPMQNLPGLLHQFLYRLDALPFAQSTMPSTNEHIFTHIRLLIRRIHLRPEDGCRPFLDLTDKWLLASSPAGRRPSYSQHQADAVQAINYIWQLCDVAWTDCLMPHTGFVQTLKYCFPGLSRTCNDQIPGFSRTQKIHVFKDSPGYTPFTNIVAWGQKVHIPNKFSM